MYASEGTNSRNGGMGGRGGVLERLEGRVYLEGLAKRLGTLWTHAVTVEAASRGEKRVLLGANTCV